MREWLRYTALVSKGTERVIGTTRRHSQEKEAKII
jgi:hypothetical protein